MRVVLSFVVFTQSVVRLIARCHSDKLSVVGYGIGYGVSLVGLFVLVCVGVLVVSVAPS